MSGTALALAAADLHAGDHVEYVEERHVNGRLTAEPTRARDGVMLVLSIARGSNVDVLHVAAATRVTAWRNDG